MDNLLGGALGSAMGKDGIAEIAGKKVGEYHLENISD